MKKLSFLSLLLFIGISGKAFTSPDLNTKPGKKARKIYTQYCASCHGEKVEAFVDRKWKHGNSKDEIVASITNGYQDAGMPTWKDKIAEKDISALAELIVTSLATVTQYDFKEVAKTDTYKSKGITVKTEEIASGLESPWGIAVLPDGDILINDRAGKMYRVDKNKEKHEITGIPPVLAVGQGGLLDVVLHPDYKNNGWIYISYSKFKGEGESLVSTTAIVRGKLNGDTFTNKEDIFEAQPYEKTRHHYGSRIAFDNKGYLFFSVGERGREQVNPQNTKNDLGKIHRLMDDGKIPSDNPFVGSSNGNESIWSYGHRNPQGLIFDPANGEMYDTEHGPRGGDELNLIKKGANYGWPVISYGINYDGTVLTPNSKQEGMEQPETYWIPSIAPCGLAYITSDKYPAWQGNIMAGSLRFNYLNRIVMKDNKVADQEKVLINVGRLRSVIQGSDGYIYIGIENPGTVYRLLPQ